MNGCKRNAAGRGTLGSMDLYDHAEQFPALLAGGLRVMTHRDLRDAGVTARAIQWKTARGSLLHPMHGVYLPTSGRAGPDLPDLLDRIRVALSMAPPLAVVSHQTAALLCGFGVVPDGRQRIHLTVPAGTPFPQRPQVAAHQAVLPVGEPTNVLGVPCTAAARTCVDLARGLRRLDALPVLDAALRCGAVTLDDLRAELAKHERLRGIRQARDLVQLADPRAECRQESQLRLRLHDGRVVGFVPQVPVRDEHGQLAWRIDLGDDETRTGLEYDGISHFDRERARSDRQRHNLLAAQGWTMRYFTDRDLYRRPERLVQTVRLAQSTARRSRANQRGLISKPR